MPERRPEYDLQIALTNDLLDRALAAAFAAGLLPSHFATSISAADGDLGLTVRADLGLGVSDVHFFSPGADREIGLRAKWQGELVIRVTLAEWRFDTPAGPYVDPGLEEVFTIPFEGDFAASADIVLVQLGQVQALTVNFARLYTLGIKRIGDLVPGRDFTEVLRLALERIAVVALRTEVRFPALNGLAASLPAPARAVTDSQSGRIGATELKVVTGTAAAPESVQLLIQARQNMGQQSYPDVVAVAAGRSDLAVFLSLRFLAQILQDLWVGQVIPRRFDDNGHPDPGGSVTLDRLSFTTTATGELRVRATVNRKVIGIPAALTATVELTPSVEDGRLVARDVDIDLDVSLGWARAAGMGALFFVLYQIVAHILLRAFADILEPWAADKLEAFLEGQSIDLRRQIAWQGTPLRLDLAPAHIEAAPTGVLVGLALNIHT
ncbi:MAG TPA: hypothetical protein VEC60_09310 [Reyranella sp.]|nr:hypothetical protein [Reyranella sp.]